MKIEKQVSILPYEIVVNERKFCLKGVIASGKHIEKKCGICILSINLISAYCISFEIVPDCCIMEKVMIRKQVTKYSERIGPKSRFSKP